METLTQDNIYKFTRFGLIAICSMNRDVCQGYNKLPINDLRTYLLQEIDNKNNIYIHQNVYNNKINLYIGKYYKK